MSIIDNPCFNCKERSLGCHSRCTAYIAYSNYRAEQCNKRRQRYNNQASRAKKWEKKWFKNK